MTAAAAAATAAAAVRVAARAPIGLRLAACLLLAAASGCDDAAQLDVRVLTATRWLDEPGSIDEIGYQVHVDVGWPVRSMTCFPLSPDLRVTVNDREPVPVVARADCEWDVLVTLRGFASDTDLTVKLHDGERLVGEATYTGMFPGFSSWRLVSPADGRVRAGEPLAIAAAGDSLLFSDTVGMYFHWLDMAGAAPPFRTFALTTAGPDRRTGEATAPPLIGRALMVVNNVDDLGYRPATSCTGFSSCQSWADASTIGPIAIEVIP
jgi:hypothetical protein